MPTEVDSNFDPTGDDQTRGWLWTHQRYDWMGRVVRKIATDGDPNTLENDSDVLISYAGCGCAGGLVTTIEGELVPRKASRNPRCRPTRGRGSGEELRTGTPAKPKVRPVSRSQIILFIRISCDLVRVRELPLSQ